MDGFMIRRIEDRIDTAVGSFEEAVSTSGVLMMLSFGADVWAGRTSEDARGTAQGTSFGIPRSAEEPN